MSMTPMYEFSSAGRTNTFAVFTELSLSVLNTRGILGFIIPSALATDTPYKTFWSHIVSDRTLYSMFDFENRGIFFPAVHRRYKFSLFTIGASSSQRQSKFGFFLESTDSIKNEEATFSIEQQKVSLINPLTSLLPSCRSSKDFQLLVSIHSGSVFLQDIATPWVGYTSSATSKDWQVNDDELVSKGGAIPLYEAKCIHQYNSRSNT